MWWRKYLRERLREPAFVGEKYGKNWRDWMRRREMETETRKTKRCSSCFKPFEGLCNSHNFSSACTSHELHSFSIFCHSQSSVIQWDMSQLMTIWCDSGFVWKGTNNKKIMWWIFPLFRTWVNYFFRIPELVFLEHRWQNDSTFSLLLSGLQGKSFLPRSTIPWMRLSTWDVRYMSEWMLQLESQSRITE